MAVAFYELSGSPVEIHEPLRLRARRKLVCRWNDRRTLVLELLGDEAAGTARSVYPDLAGLWAARVRTEPFDSGPPDNQGQFTRVAEQLNAYAGQLALVTIDYDWPDPAAGHAGQPSPQPGTVLTYRMDYSGQHLAVGSHGLRWENHATLPVPAEAVPPLRVPIIEHELTWTGVESPPWGAIRAATGCVNALPFLGAATGTILFDGATASRQFTGLAGGEVRYGWRLRYVFREKAVKLSGGVAGWNHAYRSLPADGPGWERLVDATGHRLYTETDFAGLFIYES